MKFDYKGTWQSLTTVLHKQLTINEAWPVLIRLLQKQSSKPYWQSLNILDLKSEQTELKDWIEDVLSKSPVPDDLKAFWIGIIQVETIENEVIPAIYLIGSNNYSEEDVEWASHPSYVPANRYVCPIKLREIDELVKPYPKDYQFLDWILPIAYCALTLDEIIRNKIHIKFRHNKTLRIVVGHDNGDYIEIASL